MVSVGVGSVSVSVSVVLLGLNSLLEGAGEFVAREGQVTFKGTAERSCQMEVSMMLWLH